MLAPYICFNYHTLSWLDKTVCFFFFCVQVLSLCTVNKYIIINAHKNSLVTVFLSKSGNFNFTVELDTFYSSKIAQRKLLLFWNKTPESFKLAKFSKLKQEIGRWSTKY